MKLLLENWRKYLKEDALEEGLLDFFKKKEEEGEEVVPPIPKAYIKSLRSARPRRMRHLDPRDMYNVPYISWLQNKHTPWMRELELSADNNTLSLKTAQEIADRLLSVEWRGHQHPINQEAIDKAREKIKSDFNDLFVRLGAQQGGLSVLPPEEGEGALSYADSEGGLSITEQWRKYLAEDEAQYFPWLKDLPEEPFDLVLGDRLRDLVQSGDDRFQILGTGAFRTVWAPRGDEEHVIKVVHDVDDYKLQMNKDDFETSKRYPFIFPKAYAHANDFEWIVVERVTPVTSMDEMQKVLDKSFPAEQEAILNARREANINPADPFHIMKMIMDSFRGVGSPVGHDAEAQRVQDLLAPVAGPAYQELSKAMHEFEIDKYEIGKGNIGHDSEGNFQIIDSSVFSSDWDADPNEEGLPRWKSPKA